MKRFLVLAVVASFLFSFISFPKVNFGATAPVVITLEASVTSNGVKLAWPGQNASTIYVYRDFVEGVKPITQLLPTDISYVDKPPPGPHTYGITVIGKDGRIAMRSPLVPVSMSNPDCENPNGTVLKLWIDKTVMKINCAPEISISAAPKLKNGTTYVSIRPIIEAAGGTLQWNTTTKTATIKFPPHSVELTIGKNTAIVDNKSKPIAKDPTITPFIDNGKTMLPFRFIVEAVGGSVGYDANQKRIDILMPLQSSALVFKAIDGLSAVARDKSGSLVQIKSVSVVESDNPIKFFIENAHMLIPSGEKYTTPKLLDITDPMDRKLLHTNISTWLNGIGDVKVYTVTIASKTTKLQDFTSVALFNETSGEVIDLTFLPFGLDFSVTPEKNDIPTTPINKVTGEIANYSIFWPGAKIANSNLTWRAVQVTFNATANGRMSLASLGCTLCNRSQGEVDISFRNLCQDNLPQPSRTFIPIIASLCDFSVALGKNDNYLNLSLEEGCGFFPGPSCNDIVDKYSDMAFEFIDLRPTKTTDTPFASAQLVKGSFRLQPKTGSASWLPEQDPGKKSAGVFGVDVEKAQKPKSLDISCKSNPKKYGVFLVPSIMPALQPIPGPSISIKVPILNTPSGRQNGALKLSTEGTLSVTVPFDKPTGWFGYEGVKRTITLGKGVISGQAIFECPCGESKAIERVSLKVDRPSAGSAKVKIDASINSSVAFTDPANKVDLVLERDKQEIAKVQIDYKNPVATIVDNNPLPGEIYMYCLKLYRANVEIESWCNSESILPNPLVLAATWISGGISKSGSVLGGEKLEEGISIKNLDEVPMKVKIEIKAICEGWGLTLSNGSQAMELNILAGESNEQINFITNPDVSLVPNTPCIAKVEISAGLQKVALTYNLKIDAPDCAFTAVWDEGGTGIGNDIAPGATKSQNFTIKNDGKEKVRFLVQLQFSGGADLIKGGSFWSVNFKDMQSGSMMNLEPGEVKLITIIAKPSIDMADGSSTVVDISIEACSQKIKLIWMLTCKAPECDFELNWIQGTQTRLTTTTPGDEWVEYFTISNMLTEEVAFMLSTGTDGEYISLLLSNYNFTIPAGGIQTISIECRTPDNARIGTSTIKVIAKCGKSEKMLKKSVNIQKGLSCWYTTDWLLNRDDYLPMDMPVDETIEAAIRIKNKSKNAELFAVLVQRSDESWESGFNTAKGLKQTFILRPNEETTKLILWLKAGPKTKPGDKCKVTVSIKSCSTAIVLEWDVTCVIHEELDVTISYKLDKPVFKKDNSLAVNGSYSFTRKGVGSIKLTGHQFDWYEAGTNASMGGTGAIPVDMEIYKGLPAWTYEHRIPKNIQDKTKALGGNKIRIVITFYFMYNDQTSVKKTIEYVVEIP